jgi:hypothetical protein
MTAELLSVKTLVAAGVAVLAAVVALGAVGVVVLAPGVAVLAALLVGSGVAGT